MRRQGRRVFRALFARTFVISFWVTVLCVLLGYPGRLHAVDACRSAGPTSRMALVLVPFWTSILVRTTAWFILLQKEGPVNALLQSMHIVDAPLTLIFTRFAVYVAMVHVLLPFVILPLYSVMKGIDPVYMRAAASLGAPGWKRFLRVYLPMTMPGVAAGALMVFMLVGRLLRHAGAGRRPGRPDGQLLHRVLHQPDDQLGHGGGARASCCSR